MKTSALIVFAKRPKPGAVKTRLTAMLTPEEAAQLYEAFLRDALNQYQSLVVWQRRSGRCSFGFGRHGGNGMDSSPDGG